jgi:hypothetical protein
MITLDTLLEAIQKMDAKFEARFDSVDKKFEIMEDKFDRKLEALETRIERKIDEKMDEFAGMMAREFKEMRKDIDNHEHRIGSLEMAAV